MLIRHYFAYGSNMNPARMTARQLEFTENQTARLSGFGLRFNKRAHNKQGVGYANVVYAASECVEGIVYTLAKPADISVMDPYEGAPVRYSREVFVLESDSGSIPAWVYVANAPWVDDSVLPEARYVAHLLCAADRLSSAYVDAIRRQTCLPDSAATSDDQCLQYNH